MEYVTSLSKDSVPDYDKWREFFKSKFVDMGYKYDHMYDWTINISNEFDDDSESGNSLN